MGWLPGHAPCLSVREQRADGTRTGWGKRSDERRGSERGGPHESGSESLRRRSRGGKWVGVWRGRSSRG